MKKKVQIFCLTIVVIFITGECIGRYLGLNQLSLYQEDKDFEYIPQPNQHTLVYRHKYSTNEFSMRSDPILPGDTCTALLIGDSIIYGGNSIDQDSLASTILEKMLFAKFKRRIRVLNIAAQSWGPDNGAAYIKKYGTFHARLIILVNSSHDAHDNMTFKTTMGKDPYYTKHNFLAWETIIEKGWPAIVSKFSHNKPDNLLIDNGIEFNSGFNFFDSLRTRDHIALFDYLHSSVGEIENKKYESGGTEIINFCTQRQIPLILGIEKEQTNLYMDDLHFSNQGQKLLANALYPVIANTFQQ